MLATLKVVYGSNASDDSGESSNQLSFANERVIAGVSPVDTCRAGLFCRIFHHHPSFPSQNGYVKWSMGVNSL